MERFTTATWACWIGVLAAVAAIGAAFFQRHHGFGVGFDASVASTSVASKSILEIFARNAFDWSSSTTPAPLSTTAVLVKAILADPRAIPTGLDQASVAALHSSGFNDKNDGSPSEENVNILDVRVAAVRAWVSSGILTEVKRLCHSARGCDPNEKDPEFGMTPMHFAEFWGSNELAEYLRSLGANSEIFDTVGRQPRNMTFSGFSKYSRLAGRARLPAGADFEDRCEIPEVVIPMRPGQEKSSDSYAVAAASEEQAESQQTESEWQSSVNVALAEVRRLVSEGEPVVVRNILAWLLDTQQHIGTAAAASTTGGLEQQAKQPSMLKYSDAASFVQAWSERPVDVGGVPYAKMFDLANERTTLGEFVAAANNAAKPAADDDGATTGAPARRPNYVFQLDTKACAEGRELLGRIVEAAMPSEGDQPLVCPPASGQRGLESVHYYLGGRGTGAPHHIHSDAINLAVTGRKKWWVVTPKAASWSRRHIQEYAEESERREGGNGPDVIEEYLPMQFVQRAGDLVYVPADWGHGAMNLEDDTFG